MTHKPLIGLCPLWDEKKESYWMLPGYFDAVMNAGALPIMLPLTDDPQDLSAFVHLCDGFIFTGGQDVDPAIYGEAIRFTNVGICNARDAMEQRLLNLILAEDKPMLGICRGLQFLNAALGGTLYQDLPQEKSDVLPHQQKPPYDIPLHQVILIPDTPLHQLLGQAHIGVNSYHHQAIRTLAPQLQPMAFSPDGLVEAVYMPDKKFIWAVQWHPEFAFRKDSNSQQLMQAFVASTRN